MQIDFSLSASAELVGCLVQGRNGTDDSMRPGEWEFPGAENQSAGLV